MLFNHSPTERHLRCFHFGAVRNKASMNIHVLKRICESDCWTKTGNGVSGLEQKGAEGVELPGLSWG